MCKEKRTDTEPQTTMNQDTETVRVEIWTSIAIFSKVVDVDQKHRRILMFGESDIGEEQVEKRMPRETVE